MTMSFGGHVGLRVAEGVGNAVRAHRAQQAEAARQAAIDRLNALRLQEAEFDLQSKMDRRHMEEVAQLELARKRREQQPLLEAHRAAYEAQFGESDLPAAMADYDAAIAGMNLPKALGAGRGEEEAQLRLRRLRGEEEDREAKRGLNEEVQALMSNPEALAALSRAAATGDPRDKASAMRSLGVRPEVFNAAYEEVRRGTRFDQRAPLRASGASARDPQEVRVERARQQLMQDEAVDAVNRAVMEALEAEMARARDRAHSEGVDEPVGLDPRQELAVTLEALGEYEQDIDRGLSIIEVYRQTGQPQLLMNGLGMDENEDPERFVLDVEEFLLAEKAAVLRLRRDVSSRNLRSIGNPPPAPPAQRVGDTLLEQQRALRGR